MTEHLGVEDLIELARVGRLGPVRDQGLLDSAAHRPQATTFGQEAYPTLAAKAAALLHSIARNHALIDGNKRLSWIACETFLALNGHVSSLDDDAAYVLTLAVAKGELDDVAQIAAALLLAPLET
ncbi:MAG TPA: Fic family protein [Dermatophilaceae bacterium]|nr:Fic family protein [Dermatophilaceae bacterium]